MAYEFLKPPPTGEIIPPEVFEQLLIENPSSPSGPVGRLSVAGEKSFAVIAAVVGVEFSLDMRVSLNHNPVDPGQTQVKDFKSWHIDSSPQWLVADKLPTEYLVGDEEGARALIAEFDDIEPSDEIGRAMVLLAAVNNIDHSEETLESHGLKIWRPEPRQPVYVDQSRVHRLPINTGSDRIQRVLAGILLD